MTVTVNDILHFLVARTGAQSSMGAQLERLKYGLQNEPDPFRSKNDAEEQMLNQACLLRCVSDFERRSEFGVPPKTPQAASAGFKMLKKFQDATLPTRNQGQIALGILRAFQERSHGSDECGLVAVYKYLAVIAPKAVPSIPQGNEDLLQHFRQGTAKRARAVACEAYADSLLSLSYHVRIWNKKQ